MGCLGKWFPCTCSRLNPLYIISCRYYIYIRIYLYMCMYMNIPASLSSKSPQIETRIPAWQWRFMHSHVANLFVVAGTNWSGWGEEEKRSSRKCKRQKIEVKKWKTFQKLRRFSDPPIYEKNLRIHPNHAVIACVLCSPRCQKHCKYHVFQSRR